MDFPTAIVWVAGIAAFCLFMWLIFKAMEL